MTTYYQLELFDGVRWLTLVGEFRSAEVLQAIGAQLLINATPTRIVKVEMAEEVAQEFSGLPSRGGEERALPGLTEFLRLETIN